MLDEKLIPMYQHLVDSYSVRLREEWAAKVEVSEVFSRVKEEPLDDNLVEPPHDYSVGPQQTQLSSTANQPKVTNIHTLLRLIFGPL